MDYEAFFRFTQRPFSLTPDPKFYFRSRSHGRVFDAVSAAITRRDIFVVVMGDLGVGKTTLCRTVLDLQERKSRAALVGNALLSPDDLLRLMLQDLGAVPAEDARQGRLRGMTRRQLVEQFDSFLKQLSASSDGAVLIVDEAHSLPSATKDQLVEIAMLDANRDHVLQFLLAGQPSIAGTPLMPAPLESRAAVRARLLPLERDECERYISHRLGTAGGDGVTFAADAVETIYHLSAGIPRLVNLMCERALQDAATAKSHRVEAGMIQHAASALDLIRLRPKRFRWYGTK